MTVVKAMDPEYSRGTKGYPGVVQYVQYVQYVWKEEVSI